MINEEIIQKASSFENDNIYKRFTQEMKSKFNITDPKILTDIKNEALKFLALSVIHPGTGMFSDLVDEYWHTMILFTPEYHSFCKNVGTEYIHHLPTVDENEESQTFDEFKQIYEKTFNTPLSYVWDLGDKVMCSMCKTQENKEKCCGKCCGKCKSGRCKSGKCKSGKCKSGKCNSRNLVVKEIIDVLY